jgi:TP901 family phage tail tape measure protein
MATERITIVVEESGSRVVSLNLLGIGKAASTSATNINTLRRVLTGLGATAILTNTIREIARYEQSLSTIRAVANTTEAGFAKLRETTMQLGLTTRYTATEAADGLLYLAKAGFTAQESMAAVDDTLRLAQAGAVELGRASEITVNVLRGFRLGVDQVGRVTDVLAKAANETTADVHDLAYSMKFAGPIAAGLGVSLEETAAAAGVLSSAGLQASMAGTGLRRIFSELETPSTKTKKLLREVGLSTDDVRISSLGLTQVLRNLRAAGVDAGLGLEIFGDRGGPAFEVLAKALPDLVKLNLSLDNAEGYCRNVAKIMDDNLNGALKHLHASFVALQLRIGEFGGSTVLRSMVETLTESIRFLAEHIAIIDGAFIGLAIIAIPRVIGILGVLLNMLKTNALVALGAAVGALVAFRNEIMMSADSTTSLADFGNAAWERIQLGGQAMIDSLRESFGGLTNIFDGVEFDIEGVVRFTAAILDTWIGVWRGAILAIKELFSHLGPALKDMVITWVNDLLNIMDAGFRKFYDLLGNIPGRVGEPYRRLAQDGVIPRLENVAEGASERLGQAVVTGFTNGLSEITVFQDSVNQIFDRADEIATDRLAAQNNLPRGAGLTPTGTAGAPPTEDLPQVMTQFEAGIDSGMEKIWETITKYGSQVEATLVNAFNSAEDALVSFVTTGKVDFKSLVDSMLSDLTRLISRMAMANLIEGIGSIGSAATSSGVNAGTAGTGGIHGFANGGNVTAGTPIWVGERGRELYVPEKNGQIVPNDKSEALSQSAQVNVINVMSMDEALAAMRSSAGQSIILNTKGKSRL